MGSLWFAGGYHPPTRHLFSFSPREKVAERKRGRMRGLRKECVALRHHLCRVPPHPPAYAGTFSLGEKESMGVHGH